MAAPSFTDFVDTVTGTMSPEAYGRLPQVQGTDQNAYQISGLGDYTSQLGQLEGRTPGAPDLTGATQGSLQNQQAITSYLQRVGMGQEKTAANAMFDQGAAQNARQAQSAGVSMGGGQNPALAMRQILGAQSAGMGDLAGRSAVQKMQEQQSAMQAAGQNNQAQYQMQFQNQQQTFQNNMSSINQTAQLAHQVFQANQAQTGYNVQYQQNQQAFQMWQRQQQMQQEQQQAAAVGKFIQMGLQVAGSVGGMAMGGGMGGAALGGLGQLAGGAIAGALSKKSDLSGSGQALDNVYKGGGTNPSWGNGTQQMNNYYGNSDPFAGTPGAGDQ